MKGKLFKEAVRQVSPIQISGGAGGA